MTVNYQGKFTKEEYEIAQRVLLKLKGKLYRLEKEVNNGYYNEYDLKVTSVKLILEDIYEMEEEEEI